MAPIINKDFPGFWDPITSTIDWCEKNYQVSYFIAEFWNTMSNLTFIFPPILAYLKTSKMDVPFLYLSPLLYLAFVGTGSFFFHMTLKYEMQLWDEMCMIWEGLLMCYILIKIIDPKLAKRTSTKASLIIFGVLLEASYVFIKEPLFFQMGFAVIHYLALLIGYSITQQCKCSPKVFWTSVILNHFAFFLWNIDNHFCAQLEGLRCNLNPIVIPFSQFHAVWHVIAGYATLLMIFFAIHAYLLSVGFHYDIKFSLIYGLKLIKGTKNGYTNGFNGKTC